MTLILLFVVWSVCGFWMFRCLGRTPKQCLQCVVGRYIVLLIAMYIVVAFFSK